MCGIGGILRITHPGEHHAPITDDELDAIDRRIAWRGPDGHGRFRDRVLRPDGTITEIGLVHRRLSIIDHQGGHQPMVWTPDRGIWPPPDNQNHQIDVRDADDPAAGEGDQLIALVFNGCIYNHRELRTELEAKGHVFTTDHSDTEVIIHAWNEWEHFFTDHLEGMFAFTLWDRAKRVCGHWRDRFGEKPATTIPLSENTEIFASCRADAPALFDETTPKLMSSWIRFGFHHTWTPISEWEQSVPPHWPRSQRGLEKLDHKELIKVSILMRLEADVPTAAFLSGGIDSSVIAMHAHDAIEQQGRSLTTICVRMPHVEYDESRYAEQVAQHLGVVNHLTVDAGDETIDAAGDFETLITALGLPFGDSSILPTYWACKAARPHAKVMLSGDGGDELFFGYDRYRAALLLNLLRFVPFKSQAITRCDRSDPKSRDERIARLLDAAGHAGSTDLASIFPRSDLKKLVSLRGSSRAKDDRSRPLWETMKTARDWDIANYLPGDLLRKVDTASMLAGVEVRCPFLDSQVAGAALAAPIRLHRKDGRGKYILRQMLYERLPRELIDRPKQGFAIPVGEWFRTDFGHMRTLLFDRVLEPIRRGEQPFGAVHEAIEINTAFITRIADEHFAAGGMDPPSGTTRDIRPRDHSQRLFLLCSLAIWAATLEG